MKILITGSAGFIGFHLARRLLGEGHEVLGFDGLTPYYDIRLKQARLALLRAHLGFSAVEAMLEDKAAVAATVAAFAPEIVFHLAAQAGVRHSIEHPDLYIDSNVAGTSHLLQALAVTPPRHLLVASSSSVYGGNVEMPFAETDRTDFPVSVYAATKRATEALTHAHAATTGLPVTCLRFFTVYGPWGRPDMALFRFADAIADGRPIEVYGHGRMERDFTFIDDLIEAMRRLMGVIPVPGAPVATPDVTDSLSPAAPWRVVNLAQGESTPLLAFIEAIEAAMGKRAERNLVPMQPGDVTTTWADAGLLRTLTGYVPQTSVRDGVVKFVEWHREWLRTNRT
jgi:UDP-glucuronate 4-epimerase